MFMVEGVGFIDTDGKSRVKDQGLRGSGSGFGV
jgi:hypothetical protein